MHVITTSPRLIFYEPSGKIAGTAAKGFDHGKHLHTMTCRVTNATNYNLVSDLLYDAIDAIDRCQCESGCTACESFYRSI